MTIATEEQLAAIAALIDTLDGALAPPVPAPTAIEDLSLRHLAKAVGSARSALVLMHEGCWTDACIVVRAIFEQLFTYLWVVQDPQKADYRADMVTFKQEWANYKYLEGLAAGAPEAARGPLLEAAARYREVAERMLADLAAHLGTTEKKVRDEASMRASLKAIEVNLGPPFSIPYAHYSCFVHSDGVALSAFGTPTPEGVRYSSHGVPTQDLPLADDLQRVLVRMVQEVLPRCPVQHARGLGALLAAHTARVFGP